MPSIYLISNDHISFRSLIHSSWEHLNPEMICSQSQWLHGSVGYSVASVSRGHRFKPCGSPEFFRLLYTIAKFAFITARFITSLEFELNSLKIVLMLDVFLYFCRKVEIRKLLGPFNFYRGGMWVWPKCFCL